MTKKIKRITKIECRNPFNFESAEVREPKMADFIEAEKIAAAQSGFKFMVALVSIIATFDGEKKPFEVLQDLKFSDFLELIEAAGISGSANMLPDSSSFSGKADSATPKSEN